MTESILNNTVHLRWKDVDPKHRAACLFFSRVLGASKVRLRNEDYFVTMQDTQSGYVFGHFKTLEGEEMLNHKEQQFLQLELQEKGIVRNCLNCMNWRSNMRHKEDQNSGELCDKYEVLPPPSIIVHGCEEWEFNIPF